MEQHWENPTAESEVIVQAPFTKHRASLTGNKESETPAFLWFSLEFEFIDDNILYKNILIVIVRQYIQTLLTSVCTTVHYLDDNGFYLSLISHDFLFFCYRVEDSM